MAEPTNVFDRVRVALTSEPGSAELDGLMVDVDTALAVRRGRLAKAQQTSVDPVASEGSVADAQHDLVTIPNEVVRLTEGKIRLQGLLSKAKDRERQAELTDVHEAALKERAAFSAEFGKVYAKHASALIGLLERATELDDKHNRLETPRGRHAIDVSETTKICNSVSLREIEGMDCGSWNAKKAPSAFIQEMMAREAQTEAHRQAQGEAAQQMSESLRLVPRNVA